MPQHSLTDARRCLEEALKLIDSRIADLAQSDPGGPLRDRLVVVRECIRDAIEKVGHAEEAISAGQP